MSRYDEADGPEQTRSRRAPWAWFRRPADRKPGRPANSPSPVRRRSVAGIVLGSLAIVTAIALVGTSLTVYIKYRLVWDSIKRIDVSADLRGKRPPVDPNAINLLLIGSDSRAGENGAIGGSAGIEGQRSDTVMVVHIAPGDHQVVVMSIPRDSVVPILQCSAEPGASGQAAQPGQVEQINATFAYGGPGCLWETVEQTTGIHINDFIELTFVGFEQAIDALGGVDVCLPAAVDDPMSGLDLSAGKHHVYGKEALAFWRTREDLGMGDDPQRIERDQFLMAALLQGIERSGLLHSPSKMLAVVDALTSNGNITIDNQLTASRMLQIGEDLHGITSGSVQFVTVPWTTYVPNPDWVQWQQPAASDLFTAIAHDTALPKAVKEKKGKKATKTLQPSQVQVAVFNGSTTDGLGAATVTNLSQRGFDVIGQAADAASDTYTDSVIEYASAADLPAAQTLAAEVSDVQLELDPQLGSSTLHLILGSTFSALKPPVGNQAIENLTITYGGITGNVNICDDQAAFAGPDGD
ncbi:MAG TPA: LCP family protein [Streptosporangiaceae bacterium]|nr:LCP family protein [Streptosporangiaceae bacterium]